VVEPKSIEFVVPGNKVVLMATDAKLSKAFVAKLVTEGISDVKATVPVVLGNVQVLFDEAGVAVIVPVIPPDCKTI
jgi:hypothetical protein